MIAPIDAALHPPQASAVRFNQRMYNPPPSKSLQAFSVGLALRIAVSVSGAAFGGTTPSGALNAHSCTHSHSKLSTEEISADQETLGKQAFCSVLRMSLDHLGSRDGSPGRTRTSDQRINSPSLYH